MRRIVMGIDERILLHKVCGGVGEAVVGDINTFVSAVEGIERFLH